MVESIQERVQAQLAEMVASGVEVGLQAVVIQGWAGGGGRLRGPGHTWNRRRRETRHPVLRGLDCQGRPQLTRPVLVERGVLDYELRLADVWPDFAAHGKQSITVRDVLTHQAGIPGLLPDTSTEQLCDWNYMCAQIAESRPWWPPGQRFGYHAQTFGFLLGETLQRVTGTPLSALLRQTLTDPLRIADEVHFGIPTELLPRVARQVQGEDRPPAPEPGSPLALAMPPAANPDATFANRRDVLTSNIPSMGTMSARGAARLYAALMGRVEGFTPLSREHLAQACKVVYTGPDALMGIASVSWALGYSPSRPDPYAARPGSTFGMVGTNGSAAYADLATGVAVALMRNRFSPDFTAAEQVDRIVADVYPPDPAGPSTTRSSP